MVIVTGIVLKLEQFGRTFSSLNPCPFLPSVATDDRNQFQCLKLFLNNKFAALFSGLILGGDGKDYVMDYHTLSHSTQARDFFVPYFQPPGSCFPSLICPRIVRVCNVLSVHKYSKNFCSPCFTALFTNMQTPKFKSPLDNCVFRCHQS